jgi:hypothetical protein
MAEELREKETLRQRGAVDGDEDAVATWRLRVQSLGRELLAGPGLAVEEDRQLPSRQSIEARERIDERRARAQDEVRGR